MIVGPLATEERDGQVRRSATLRWRGGERELFSVVPSAWADKSEDATGFLSVALPLAMRRGEDLDVRGPVSPRFLNALEALQECYSQWNPEMARIAVSASPGEPREPAGGRGVFLSRGVDSLFAAARDAHRLRAAVHVVGIEPIHDEHVRDQEALLAGRAAADLGLESVVVEANVRELSGPVFADWEDFVAPGLAFCAHALAGGLQAVLIGSADTYATIEPCGTSPLLDPLYSSEAMELEHAAITHSRLGKVKWLAAHRPDLLPQIKVCYGDNRTDNCGHCAKCVVTMAALHASGALADASQFPGAIDPAMLVNAYMSRFKSRLDWTQLAAALSPDDPLIPAIRLRLEQTRLLSPWSLPPPVSIRDRHRNAVFECFFGPGDEMLGLVRTVDGERHRYGVGATPTGELTGELGALHAAPRPGSVPVWLTADGLLVSASGAPPTPPPRPARWVLAPLRWAQESRLSRETLTALAWRLARANRSPAPVAAVTGAPAGYLHAEAGEGRLPLYSARHAITGDQLLSTDPREPGDWGYGPAVLLGYLDAVAPITATLGITAHPHLIWASRFGPRPAG